MAIVLGRKGGGSGGGGGGGGLPEDWTNDGTTLESNGGYLDLGSGNLLMGGGLITDAGQVIAVAFSAEPETPGDTSFDGNGGKIIDLAEGTDPSDAATVGQLNGVEESIPLAIAGSNIRTAAGVPSGAPDPGANELPFAYDTTAVTGGFYYWNGAAWVKIATIL